MAIMQTLRRLDDRVLGDSSNKHRRAVRGFPWLLGSAWVTQGVVVFGDVEFLQGAVFVMLTGLFFGLLDMRRRQDGAPFQKP